MKIIADSGSTQCTWIAAGGSGNATVRTRGINAVQQSEEEIAATLAALPAWFGAEAEKAETPEETRKESEEAPCAVGQPEKRQDARDALSVIFYGAGCGEQFPSASEKIASALRRHFRTPQVGVHSDLLGAARALFGRGEGIACILGTGSNSCHCRGGAIVRNVPPLGYILGDEGSGAALGRNLLNGIFKGHIPLRRELEAATGLDYEAIIRRVYRESAANRFLASLAPFVHAHLDCPAIRNMVAESFRDFARRNLSHYPAALPVACVGGVAAHFAGPLREALAAEGYAVRQIVESPAEGLIRYHHGA